MAVILVLARRIADAPPEARARFDLVGAVLSAVGLGLAVFGVLRSAEWGWVTPKPDGPSLLGISPTIWLILAGLLVVLGLLRVGGARAGSEAGEPLVRPSSVRQPPDDRRAVDVLLAQYLVQAGLFFTIPLFLSVSLGLSALETGLRILPLSVTLLAAAVGIPRFFPAPPRAGWSGSGCSRMFLGMVVLLRRGRRARTPRSSPSAALAGLGIGALASQLGAVTVSAVPDEQSPEVGGLQNTATNLGAAIGTALAGSILIAALTRRSCTGSRQPGDPATGAGPGHRELASRRAVRVRRPLERAHRGRGASRTSPPRPWTSTGGPRRRPALRARRPRADRPDRAFVDADPPRARRDRPAS